MDVEYHSSQTVSGRGFMRSFRDYSTFRPAASLVNQVHVTFRSNAAIGIAKCADTGGVWNRAFFARARQWQI